MGTPVDRRFSAALFGGLCAGCAGLLCFLAVHALWIAPIWFILPMGLIFAAVGGLAAGWSYAEIGSALPPRPWRPLAVLLLFCTLLLPAEAFALLRDPFPFDAMENLSRPELARWIVRLIGELPVTATVSGALLGWALKRNRRAVVSTALAGLVFALGPGHNIPFIAGTPAVHKMNTILVLVLGVSSIVLVEVEAWVMAIRHPLPAE